MLRKSQSSNVRFIARSMVMVTVAMLMFDAVFAADDQALNERRLTEPSLQDGGLAELHRVVDAACDCAAGQSSGMAAALACTQGARDFGRLKVMHRDAWDDAARARAGDLEKVIQSCLSNALSAAVARDRLGQPPIRADGTVPAIYWRQIEVRELSAGSSSLVRVRHGNAATISTGMVMALDAGRLELRRARSDGGGSERIVLRDIAQAWIMVVRDAR